MNNNNETRGRAERSGISLRRLQIFMIFVTTCVSFALLYYTFVSFGNYKNLSKATDEYISLHAAAAGLLEASDYLTEMAQRFTDRGDMRYLDAYFKEADVTKRREKALEEIGKFPECGTALEKLSDALRDSVELMNREYYSMKLVIEAMGYRDYPDVLKDIVLDREDEALSPDGKMTLARKMLLDEVYYVKKDSIRANMSEGQDELTSLSNKNREYLEELYQHDTRVTRALIVAQVGSFFLIMLLTMHLGIIPILKAVDDIQADNRIHIGGASEFRYLASAYNKMFESHQADMRLLNYKATHDELTNVYNRVGYDLLLQGIDLKVTCFIILDIDNFKIFNDTMGHDTGDRVLKNVADTLKNYFRSVDCICRIGGDEFAIIATGIEHNRMGLIAAKLEAIEKNLGFPEGDEPAVTLSIGVSHGAYAESVEELFVQADKALYESKENGKNQYTFYK